jgi:hypothetical protein
MLSKKEEIFYEKVSKEEIFLNVVKIFYKKGFKKINTGVSCAVFLSKSKKYVIKCGINMDSAPTKRFLLHDFYAKIIYRSRNGKILIQEKVNTNKGSKAFQKLTKEYIIRSNRSSKVSISTIYQELDFKYDLRPGNCGMLRESPKFFDYRNYTSTKILAEFPSWDGYTDIRYIDILGFIIDSFKGSIEINPNQ